MKKRPLYLRYAGPVLLETPLLNKGNAFTREERRDFNLTGLLPDIIETIDEQVQRAYAQLSAFHSNMEKHIYLRTIQDTNETLYFRLVTDHLEEIMPLIYTPTVGEACQQFSRIYRRHRGLFISYTDRDNIEDMLQNATKQSVKVIVLTDGERILGLGDQGIGGMGIPIGKLALYSACGGISPAYTLPITLDVGTNNQALIDDPLYMGWRHARISGQDYDDFVDDLIQALKCRWPDALLQFEDFAGANANRLLDRYRDQLCCFNDDIQGTAAVTLGTLLAACKQKGEQLKEQTITFCGAGAAGCGIAEQLVAQMVNEGLTETAARRRIFMINSKGLVVDSTPGLKPFQQALSQPDQLLADWGINSGTASLADTVALAKATVLIGVSAVPGLFTQAIIEQMTRNSEQPVILPLSNPTTRVEAQPEAILRWSQGKAIVASGSPFEPVLFNGKYHKIAQCNNSYIFPGIGLGVIASKASRVTQNMLMAASHALADYAHQQHSSQEALLPDINAIRDVSRYIATCVFRQAITDGVAADASAALIDEKVNKNFWTPSYRHYRRTAF
ncbi:MAG: NAD-dependent malic enzyme [Cellvibrionaceae bacterium]|nr:NAD-dependent malic enzyme [Cellvibrionaceae bacterium]